jgi:hypothetical protein
MNCLKSGKLAAWFFFVLAGVVVLGCDHPVEMKPDVPTDQRILWPVADVDDRSSSPGELELMKKVFVPGSEPDKKALLRYPAYRYQGTKIVQSGDTATVRVVLTDAKTGNPAGEVEWSLVKMGDNWRIKDAPLPAAGNPAVGKSGG